MSAKTVALYAIISSALLLLATTAHAQNEPAILHPTDDAFIWRAHSAVNFGYFDSMWVRNTGQDLGECISLVKFNLSSIPPGAQITSATLHLYYHNCSYGDPAHPCRYRYLTTHRITSDWDEDIVTWDNIMYNYEIVETSVSQIPTCFSWIGWDVTGDVQNMIDGVVNNYGWMIMDDVYHLDDPPIAYFRTKESGDHIPFLEIIFESEAWPMFHHDTSHRGYNDSGTPETNEKLWDVSVGSCHSSPAVVDGRVYAAGSNDLYCFDAAGNGEGGSDLIWSRYMGLHGYIYSSPAVADGRVYVGSDDDNISCIDAEGNGDGTTDLVWSYTTGDRVQSNPAVTGDRVYVGSWDYNVYCLDAAGNGDETTNLIWSYATGGVVHSSPAVADGRVYIGSTDNNVYCLDAEGNGDETTDLVWSFTTGDAVSSSPAVVSGRVYIGSDDGNVYCLDAAGNGDGTTNVIWSHAVGYDLYSPAVAYGKVYIGASDYQLYCLDAWGNCDGTTDLIWIHALSGRPNSPAVADGKIYIGSYDGVLSCIDAQGNGDGTTDLLWSYATFDDIRSAPAIAEGRIYIGSLDHHLYCLGAVPVPDPVQSWVEPWDSYGQAFVCPGTGTSCDSVTVAVLDENGDPCPYFPVEIDLSGCSGLCIDSPDGLSGTTDRNGIVRLDPRVGGCADCDVIVRAMDTDIRAYPKIASADWDGNWADGKVETVDSLYFMSQFGQPFPGSCADYNGDGSVNLTDLAMLAFCMGSSNAATCSLYYDCEVLPDLIDFGTLTTGSALDTTFVIRNTGSASLCDTVSLSCSCGYFSLVSGGGLYYLPSGDSLVVTVRFAPADTGTFACTIETGDIHCGDVQCTGTGIQHCSVAPTVIDFGVVFAGCHLDTIFTIINNQDVELTGSVTESCPCDSITAGGGPYALAPGETLRVSVRFRPTVPGTHSCIIDTGDSLCCDVLCTGSTPFYTTTGFLKFGEVELATAKDLSFSIKNNRCSGSLAGFVRELFDYDDFSIVSGTGSFNLAPGESRDVTVRFLPASRDLHVCIIDTGNDSIRDVSCSGRGKYAPRGSKTQFFLEQNDPNPFNPVTEIRYNIPNDTRVILDIYNILGQRIVTLVDEFQSAGFKIVRWDGKDDRNTDVSSGIYFCRIQAGSFTATRKIVLLR